MGICQNMGMSWTEGIYIEEVTLELALKDG